MKHDTNQSRTLDNWPDNEQTNQSRKVGTLLAKNDFDENDRINPFTQMESNPKGTKVHRCVEKVKAKGGDVNAYAVCQKSTGQSYKTGKKL